MKQVEHSIEVSAPVDKVISVIGDVTSWPLYFPPTVHAERLSAQIDEHGDCHEQIRIWAMANGEMRSWTSGRVLSSDGARIDFEQVEPQHPVAALGGTWLVQAAGDNCLVRLLHHYAAVDDDAEALHLIERAVDTNSRSELAALKASAEAVADDLLVSFEDTVVISAGVERAYGFINDADLWPARLPHVARVDLVDRDGLQTLEMDTRSPDGSLHTTKSGRVCFDNDRILYKQSLLPAGMRAHVGHWTFRATAEGTAITSHHSVILDPQSFATLPNPPRDLDHARAAVTHALLTNSRTTMTSAGDFLDQPTVSA